MTKLTTQNEVLLKDCSEAFNGLKKSVWDCAALLYEIDEKRAWEGKYEHLGAYLDDADISRGFASKLLKDWRHYVIEGGVSPRNLEGLDYEKAYMATKLAGSPELQLSKALTLTRKELKQERGEDEPHEHEWNTYCTICGIKQSSN